MFLSGKVNRLTQRRSVGGAPSAIALGAKFRGALNFIRRKKKSINNKVIINEKKIACPPPHAENPMFEHSTCS